MFSIKVSNQPEFTRFEVTRNALISIRYAARIAKPNVHISLAPSPLDFAKSLHNIDWALYLQDEVVMEVE